MKRNGGRIIFEGKEVDSGRQIGPVEIGNVIDFKIEGHQVQGRYIGKDDGFPGWEGLRFELVK
jgi:hypothetical protein